jgi:tRNA (adenine22-N1)-methyltransferase
MIQTILSARLQSIADEILVSFRLIDVGSDHGFLSSYVLERRLAQSVIATDIHQAPAERTREYLSRQGFSQQSEVYCRDGLSGIMVQKDDTVIIAGIGGLEIIQILDRALGEHEGALPMDAVFLLQPQRSEEELRTFLCSNRFSILSEKICFDRGRAYIIIRCRYSGKPCTLSLEQSILGPYVIEAHPEGTARYLAGKIRSLEKQRLGRPELDSVIRFANELMMKEGGTHP